jgi:hypothetical protein
MCNQIGPHISVHFSPSFAYYKFILTLFHMVILTFRKEQVQIMKFFVIRYYESIHSILWRVYQLLGNDSVNIFPRKPTRATIGRLSLDNGAVNTLHQQYRLCFPWGPCRGVMKGHRRRDLVKNSSREWRVEFRDPSLLGYELGIELSQVSGISRCRIMAREELGCSKKNSYAIWSDSEIVIHPIHPLPGYD